MSFIRLGKLIIVEIPIRPKFSHSISLKIYRGVTVTPFFGPIGVIAVFLSTDFQSAWKIRYIPVTIIKDVTLLTKLPLYLLKIFGNLKF